MSTVEVVQPHKVSLEDAKVRLASFEQQLGKVGAKLEWSGPKAEIKGMGVSGDVTYTPADVKVRVELGWMAKAAGVDPERLKGAIQRRLAEAFG